MEEISPVRCWGWEIFVYTLTLNTNLVNLMGTRH